MYAHAYHIEFGADWEAVEARYRDAVAVAPQRALEQPEFAEVPSVTAEDLQAMLNSGEKVQIIDTRPRHYSTRSDEIVEGAVWRDPERIEEWMGTLSKEEPVVTFC